MRWLYWILLGGVVLGASWVAAAFVVSPIVPQSWTPPPNPGLTGAFAPNQRLAGVTQIAVDGIGPEDVACSADGTFYTGLVDGRILKWSGDESPAEFANTGGRPLGMELDAAGNLVVADAFKGLVSISPSGDVEVLADQHDGRPMLFVDDVAIAGDGLIWFSDASQRFSFDQTLLDFFEGTMTGRLLSYDPVSGETRVHIEGLFFANGVTLGPEDAYVLVNETGLGRIQRLWLKGPLAGTTDMFVEHLPGTPDNINFDGVDTFWVAMPSLRDGIDQLAGATFLRRLASVLPASVLDSAANITSFVVGIRTDGTVVANLQDPAMGYNYITSATPCGDELWLGSLHMPAVAHMPLGQGD